LSSNKIVLRPSRNICQVKKESNDGGVNPKMIGGGGKNIPEHKIVGSYKSLRSSREKYVKANPPQVSNSRDKYSGKNNIYY
jgi:hypothetical protein